MFPWCVFPLRVSFSICIHASHNPSCLFALVVWQLNSSRVSCCCDPVFQCLLGKSQQRPPSHLSCSSVSSLFCLKVSLSSHPDGWNVWVPEVGPSSSRSWALFSAVLWFIFACWVQSWTELPSISWTYECEVTVKAMTAEFMGQNTHIWWLNMYIYVIPKPRRILCCCNSLHYSGKAFHKIFEPGCRNLLSVAGLAFQIIPKLLDGVVVDALCRPFILPHQTRKPFLHAPCFVYSGIVMLKQEKALPKLFQQSWKHICLKYIITCCSIKISFHWN